MIGFPHSKILINPELVSAMPETLFDYGSHRAEGKYAKAGRGTIVRFQHQNQPLILKTYKRGGLPGCFIRESYFYNGIENTRMWQEFRLLQALHRLGLPVPRPVAARCVMMTPLTYRGELIMEEIAESKTLVDVLAEQPLSPEAWSRIGRLIAEFHHHGVYHGDLNASNILLSKDGSLYLIDFDKSAIRNSCPVQAKDWQASNLWRLQRSLLKFARRLESLHFNNDGWQVLMQGYIKARQRLGETAFACIIMEDFIPLLSAVM